MVHPRSRPGFTLLDVLVSISVIAVLIGILLPSLGHLQESARRVRCQAQLSHVGYAMVMYADANDGFLPEHGSRTHDPDQSDPKQMMLLHRGDHLKDWDALGLLFAAEFLSSKETFYCPSHSGSHSLKAHQMAWSYMDKPIVGNYQFRLLPRAVSMLEQLPKDAALVSDGLRTRPDYNHQVGNNVLRTDSSVAWYADQGEFILSALPRSDEGVHTGFGARNSLWTTLDYLSPPRPDNPREPKLTPASQSGSTMLRGPVHAVPGQSRPGAAKAHLQRH